MTVFVDALFQAVPRNAIARQHGNYWCHLFSDSDDLTELHDLARAIGLPEKYFQGEKFPHYDLTPSKRTLAIKAGAIEVQNITDVFKPRDFLLKIRQWKERLK